METNNEQINQKYYILNLVYTLIKQGLKHGNLCLHQFLVTNSSNDQLTFQYIQWCKKMLLLFFNVCNTSMFQIIKYNTSKYKMQFLSEGSEEKYQNLIGPVRKPNNWLGKP